MSEKKTYTIDWRIEGTWSCKATSADEAQDLFDKAWGVPKGIMPMRDGEVSSDRPELQASQDKPEKAKGK